MTEVGRDRLNALRSEIDVLKALNHPNIIDYVDAKQTSHNLYIVMELMSFGSLSHIIKQYGTFPDYISGYITAEVLQGVGYLHYSGLIHRDIKGGNILLSGTGHIKLADFGVCCFSHTHRADRGRGAQAENTVTGTPYYMAPEVIELSDPVPASDIWSVGCTVCELMTGQPPYSSLTPLSALYHTVNDVRPPISSRLTEQCKSFVLQCFSKDPSVRATATDLASHPWVVTSAEQFRSVDLVLGPDLFSKECLELVKEGATPLMHGNTSGSNGFNTAIMESIITAIKKKEPVKVIAGMPQRVVEKGMEDGLLDLVFGDRSIEVDCAATVLERVIECGFADKIITHHSGMDYLMSQIPHDTFRFLTILARIEEVLPCLPLRDVLFDGQFATKIAAQQLPLTIYTARLIELQLQCPGRKVPSKVIDYLLDSKKYIPDPDAPISQRDPVDKCGSRVVATVLRCFILILDESHYPSRNYLGCFPARRSFPDLKTKHAIWKASEFILKTHPECCDTAAKLLPILFNKQYSNSSISCMLPLIQQIAVSGVSSQHNEHILEFYLYVANRKKTTEEMRGVLFGNLTAWMSCSSVLASAITNFPICELLIEHWCGTVKRSTGAEGIPVLSTMCTSGSNIKVAFASSTSFRNWAASLFLDPTTTAAAAKLIVLVQDGLPEGYPKISPTLQKLTDFASTDTDILCCVADEIRDVKLYTQE
eukprot:TRINITY_DN9363_c1_g1_i1.p1 TRINITY_DN9363_c1_g1~~TRINITY_DN9363_c1_g1_i1.p1  ORF type:complete len:775 (+),score=78.49 TRINITY_DN9363_c1_g1_i1:202-2325(+)